MVNFENPFVKECESWEERGCRSSISSVRLISLTTGVKVGLTLQSCSFLRCLTTNSLLTCCHIFFFSGQFDCSMKTAYNILCQASFSVRLSSNTSRYQCYSSHPTLRNFKFAEKWCNIIFLSEKSVSRINQTSNLQKSDVTSSFYPKKLFPGSSLSSPGSSH
jgi:hypothetical protein